MSATNVKQITGFLLPRKMLHGDLTASPFLPPTHLAIQPQSAWHVPSFYVNLSKMEVPA